MSQVWKSIKVHQWVFQERTLRSSMASELAVMCSSGLHAHCSSFSTLFVLLLPYYLSYLSLSSSPAASWVITSKILVTTRLCCMCVCYDWLACSVPLHTGSLLSPPAPSASHLSPPHRNSVLSKITHLLNEFPSAPVWCALLPGTPLFNWSASPAHNNSQRLWRAVK